MKLRKLLVDHLLLGWSVLTCANPAFAETGEGLQATDAKPRAARAGEASEQRHDEVDPRLQTLAEEAKKAAQEASLAAEKAAAFASAADKAAQRAIDVETGRRWYQEPGWYALGTPIVLAIIAVLAFKERKRASIADAQRHALLRAVEINEAFIRHKIRGPVALSFDIPDSELQTFTKKVVLLLHQLVLLRQIYEQKDLLGNLAEQSHQQWASKVLKPWIYADPDLIKVWEQLRQGGDLFEADFLKWLEPYLPGTAPANQPTAGP